MYFRWLPYYLPDRDSTVANINDEKQLSESDEEQPLPPTTNKSRRSPTSRDKSRPSLVREALLAGYEKRIKMLYAIVDGAQYEIRTHISTTTSVRGRKVTSKSQEVRTFTPTLDERLRAMEHLAKFGLGSPNVNLDKDGENAPGLVIKEIAE